MDKESCLPYQSTKDVMAIKPSATVAVLTVHPEGIQDGNNQDTGPR